MAIILDYTTRLGFEQAEADIENMHRTGKKQGERPRRHIFAKLYSRPFKRKLLQRLCFGIGEMFKMAVTLALSGLVHLALLLLFVFPLGFFLYTERRNVSTLDIYVCVME